MITFSSNTPLTPPEEWVSCSGLLSSRKEKKRTQSITRRPLPKRWLALAAHRSQLSIWCQSNAMIAETNCTVAAASLMNRLASNAPLTTMNLFPWALSSWTWSKVSARIAPTQRRDAKKFWTEMLQSTCMKNASSLHQNSSSNHLWSVLLKKSISGGNKCMIIIQTNSV